MTMATKFVYLFGTSRTQGASAMKNLLGGKGANLAEMANLGIPVPAGFADAKEIRCSKRTAWWRWADSNRRPKNYEFSALTS